MDRTASFTPRATVPLDAFTPVRVRQSWRELNPGTPLVSARDLHVQRHDVAAGIVYVVYQQVVYAVFADYVELA